MAPKNIHLIAELENRVRFETLISDISARFVRLPSNEVDSEIDRAMKLILDFFNVDRCGMLGVREDKQFVWVTHACYAEGIGQVSKDINLIELFPWSYEKLIVNGLPVRVERMAELPPESEQDRISWAAMGVKSNLAIPLFSAQGIQHMLVIHSVHKERDWPEEFVQRLNLLGDIFVNALDRRKADKALRESESSLYLAADSAGAGLWSWDFHTSLIWVTEKTRMLYGFQLDKRITADEFLCTVHPDDRDRVDQTAKQAFKEGADFLAEYRIVLPDRGFRWIKARGKAYLKPSGEPDCMMGVSLDVTERKGNEKDLMDSRETLRAFTSKLLTIQEEERRRLARELHDDFTQRLAVLAMDMSRLELSAKAENSKFESKMKYIKDQIIKLSTDIHDISRQLHPSIIDDLGLGRAIQSECSNFTRRVGIVINYNSINIPLTIPHDISVGLFRITQEALRNIQKHAQVKEADVLLVGENGHITLTIHDSGAGFDPECVRQTHSLGLFSMKERVQLIQGVFSIESAPELGTQIKVVVPLKGIENEQIKDIISG